MRVGGFSTIVIFALISWNICAQTPSQSQITPPAAAPLAPQRDQVPYILPYLARASAHFSMLKLAYNGSLENKPEQFARYVYLPAHRRKKMPHVAVR